MGYIHTGDPHEIDGLITQNIMPAEVEAQESDVDHDISENNNLEAKEEDQTEGNQQEIVEGEAEGLRNYSLARDIQRRSAYPPVRFGHADLVSYALFTAETIEHQEPRNYTEAINSLESEKWMAAMIEELQSLEKNNTL